jgi:arginase
MAIAVAATLEQERASVSRVVNILHVETNLGLRPGGVERLGAALLGLGLAERVSATSVDTLRAAPFVETRDPAYGTRNLQAIAQLAVDQADRIGQIVDSGAFPLVLGGDDSVLLGCLLALRRCGSPGLVFIDGHTDFWDLPNALVGEFSESDLWVATGHGPEVVADLEGRRPLVDSRACVVYGHRDRQEQLEERSEDVYREPMLVRGLGELRAAGMRDAGNHAVGFLAAAQIDGAWLHIDADCLDDALMPAVDWRTAGGLTEDELVELARIVLGSGLVLGMDVTIYNPGLDSDDLAAGRVLAGAIEQILR